MSNVFTVALGGALGAVCRYLITLLPMNPESGFPVKTFLINVAGSFLIGVVAALAARNALNPRTVLFLKVGICGGFTTFSSFALETEGLVGKGNGHRTLVCAAEPCMRCSGGICGREIGWIKKGKLWTNCY